MSTTLAGPKIIFPENYDARSELETPARGYLSDVVVQIEDGSRYKLFFIDPVRLGQTLEDDVKEGHNYYTEAGLVILPEVTTSSIQQAVQGLWRDGYFESLKPLESVDQFQTKKN